MIKGSLMLHLGPIWYHSEPLDVPIPKTSQDQFLDLDFSYSKTTLAWFCWFGSEGTQVELKFRKFQKQIVFLI